MANNRKKILVTGATGFIGTVLVKKLHDLGYNLRLFIRKTSNLTSFKDLKDIEYVVGDVTNAESLKKAIKNVDVIFHLAAYVAIWAKDKSIYKKINVEGTENIAKLALENNIRLIYVSSFTAIGPTPREPVNEDYEKTDEFYMDYERTKYQGKKLIREYVKNGLNGVIVYPGIVYGPGDFNIFGEMLYDIVRGKFLGCPGKGDSIACFSYVNDIVDGMVKILENDQINNEEFILGGENIEFIEYLNMIATLADKKEPRHFPMMIAKVYGWLCELKAKITGNIPYITRDTLNSFELNRAYSSENAKKQLGYEITPLKEGLEKTVKWYKNFIENEKESEVKAINIEILTKLNPDIEVIN